MLSWDKYFINCIKRQKLEKYNNINWELVLEMYTVHLKL